MTALRTVLLWLSLALAICSAPAQDEPSDEGFAAMLKGAQDRLQRGEFSAATAKFDELLDELSDSDPTPEHPDLTAAAHFGLWTIARRRGQYEEVRDSIATAEPDLRNRREVVLLRADVLNRLGAKAEAAKLLRGLVEANANDLQARHELGVVLAADGQRNAAREVWQQNAAAPGPHDALQLAFLGRSLFALGGRANLEAASRALVDSIAKAPERREARITLGQVKFAAYGEVRGFPSGERDLKQVLETYVDDEEALLAMFHVRSANGMLDAEKTESYLERLIERNERCVEAIVLRAGRVLDDRRYRDAARMFDVALTIDANDRLTLCHRAAAAWLLDDKDGYAEFRARALAGDAGWPECDWVLAEHMCALYRFADALPFYAAALAADANHVRTLHGMARALIYTGDGGKAKELLQRAKSIDAGMLDAWRNNALAVQQLLDDEYTIVENDRFTLQLHRDDVDVLQHYLLPIQLEAATVLGRKYGWQPNQPTRVEVLQTWDDFSVRTVGFRGFTALGACFGRLITMVSPVDVDLRRQDFMWEATAWHEYAHVLTLGVSNNRVPRWLTEGFSVYEERARDPSWERGMDRELLNAFASQDIPPVHLLNRLFRGPRILFGYYQGGLIVELLEKQHGFAKALDLLRAFGDDLDTEEAFQRALGHSSRAFDRQFLEFVGDKLRHMRVVPRLESAALQRVLQRATADKTDVQARIDLAWACLHRDNPVDAGRWLGEALRLDADNAQAQLIRAELLRRRGDLDQALEHWRRGFQNGADDFDSRIACGRVLAERGELDAAIDMWRQAKVCWPTCTEQDSAPELLLARVYRDRGELAEAQREMKDYCRRTARAFRPRWELAEFERDAGRREAEAAYLVECNRIDPFHRELHLRLGDAYEALGKRAEAALEFEVAAAVSPKVDRRYLTPNVEAPVADSPEDREERGSAWLRAAKLRRDLGANDRALQLLERVLTTAPDSDAATSARALQQEWRGR